MKIAVDAMGGDRAPEEILLGVARAFEKEFVRPSDVILVCAPDAVERCFSHAPVLREGAVKPATDAIEKGESPVRVLRKPLSSIMVAMDCMRKREAVVLRSSAR